MDAPGTESRRAYNRSTILFSVAFALLVAAFAIAIAIPPASDDPPGVLFKLGLFLVTPAAVILWAFSFQAVRRRPALAVLLIPAAYFGGFVVFLNITLALDRLWI